MTAGGGRLGVSRGAALYVGSLIGPGVLLVPSLALAAAGPASVIAWAALIVVSAPLAVTFAALGVRHPVSGGVAAYVRAAFGDRPAAITGGCFLTAVLAGAPAVSLIGGLYVSDLTGGGTTTAALVGLAMFTVVLGANALGLHISSALQLGLSTLLFGVIVVALAVALPSRAGDNWHPFAPHGWLAVGTAANILLWLFVGWEAVAQLVGEFRRPALDLPRAMALAFGAVTLLYLGLAVATVAVTSRPGTHVPLADLMGAGFGHGGRDATAVLAVALTMGTMNVYLGGSSKLAAALAADGALPAWVVERRPPSIPRRPLLGIGVVGVVVLAALVAGIGSASELVRATSACFVVVYVLATGAAVRLLPGVGRACAAVSLLLVVVVAVFSGPYLLVPAVAAAVAYLVQRRSQAACPTALAGGKG